MFDMQLVTIVKEKGKSLHVLPMASLAVNIQVAI